MKKGIKFLILRAFMACAALPVSAQQKITFIASGKSNYHIVLSPSASPIEKQAATVLQTYFTKISNCTLPITTETANAGSKQIIIGYASGLKKQDTAGLSGDGVLIKSVGSSLLLSGGKRKGVLYSVYVFLEQQMNCRFYSADCIMVPSQSTLSFPTDINIRQVPSFSYRMSLFNNLTKEFCDFNRQNYFLEDWGLWVHSFEVLAPVEKYFNIHPEYYALVNGRRVPDQLCLSNPVVLQIVEDDLKKRIQANPLALYWSVSQNDNEHYCQCENCKKLDAMYKSHQGSLLIFVNKIAKNFPNKIIATLAYQYSQQPPVGLKPEPNVMIMLCRINEERRVPLAKRGDNAFAKDFQGWQALTNRLFIWDYVVQFTSPFNPFPNLCALQPNIQYFSSHHAGYLFEQGINNQTAEFAELKAYLISKLMWNKNVNAREEMQNFLTAFYGTIGAVYIKQYIDLLQSNADKSNASLSSFGFPYHAANYYLTPVDINAYKALFEEALSKIDVNGVYYKRVSKEYLSVLFAELEINKPQFMKNKSAAGQKLLDDFYQKAKTANISVLNESKKTIQAYYDEYKKSVQQ